MTTEKQRMKTTDAYRHVADWPWPFYPPYPHTLNLEEQAERKVLMDRARAETGWLVDGGRRIEFKGARLELRVSSRYASTSGTVKLHSGTWPSDHELLALADHCDPNVPMSQSDHFGGVVSPIKEGEDTRDISVYTD